MQITLKTPFRQLRKRVGNYFMLQHLKRNEPVDTTVDHRFDPSTHQVFKQLRNSALVDRFSAVPTTGGVMFTIHLRDGEVINTVVLARIRSILGTGATFQFSNPNHGIVKFKKAAP